MTDEELREKLASIEHERRSHWQKYVHSKGKFSPSLGIILPWTDVYHWERQINTPYEELSEREKDSDRAQVDLYWDLLQERIKQERKVTVAEFRKELEARRDEDQYEVKCAEAVEDLMYHAGRRDLATELLHKFGSE